MKNRILILGLLFVVSINSISQMVVTNPTTDFQDALKWAEEKVWEANDAADRAEMLIKLREQLEQLEETRRNVEQAYKLQEKVQNDLRVLGAVADGGVASLANAFETVLGQSINPSFYIPNIPQFQNFRNAMDYDAASYLSSDTRSAHRELFTYDKDDPENKDGLSLTKDLRAFGKTTANIIGLSEQWDAYGEEKKAREIIQNKILVDELRMEAKLIMEEVKREDHLTMSDAERMDMMLKAAEMLEKASDLESKNVNAISMKINNQLPEDFEVVNAIESGVQIRMAHTLNSVIRPYNSNQKFSLANFEKSYTQGKINSDIQRGIDN